jgi:hypothetical protein
MTAVQHDRLFTSNGTGANVFAGYFYEQIEFTEKMGTSEQTAVRDNLKDFYSI